MEYFRFCWVVVYFVYYVDFVWVCIGVENFVVCGQCIGDGQLVFEYWYCDWCFDFVYDEYVVVVVVWYVDDVVWLQYYVLFYFVVIEYVVCVECVQFVVVCQVYVLQVGFGG